MKTLMLIALLCGAFLPWTEATSVFTGAATYPVNMGPESDATRIPVGSIPCESNHGYGLLELISTPFPSVPGGWLWDGGIELNGNLPSAFGISVRPGDSTDPTSLPVVVHIRKQATPGYSPYTKEQVLLATMRCLLDAVRATPKRPLTVKVVTDDPADEALRRFSGEYLTRSTGKDDFEATPLPGCATSVDRNGVREIVFVEKDRKPAPSANPKPLWMPFPIEGDSDPGFLLLPIWTGNAMEEDRLAPLGQPWPLMQDCFNPTSGNPDGNLMTREDLIHSFRAGRTADKVILEADLNLTEDWDLADGMALLCWAAVLSEHPTDQKPLEVTLRMSKDIDPRFQAWVAEHGWEKVPIAGDTGIRTTFVWDEGTGALTKGFIPKYRVDRNPDGGWEVTNREAYERAVKTAAEAGVALP